jgi:hypothetical protein
MCGFITNIDCSDRAADEDTRVGWRCLATFLGALFIFEGAAMAVMSEIDHNVRRVNVLSGLLSIALGVAIIAARARNRRRTEAACSAPPATSRSLGVRPHRNSISADVRCRACDCGD